MSCTDPSICAALPVLAAQIAAAATVPGSLPSGESEPPVTSVSAAAAAPSFRRHIGTTLDAFQRDSDAAIMAYEDALKAPCLLGTYRTAFPSRLPFLQRYVDFVRMLEDFEMTVATIERVAKYDALEHYHRRETK